MSAAYMLVPKFADNRYKPKANLAFVYIGHWPLTSNYHTLSSIW